MRKIFGKKWLWYLGFILFIPSFFLNLYFYHKERQAGILVIEVLDGDTLLLEGKVRLRLRHVDAPELKYCGGNEAKNLLVDLVKGKRITLKEEILDQYGRPMALVYKGSQLVNLEMLQSGWVRFHHDQSSKEKILKETADKVKKEEKGIYSSLCYQKENLENPACQIKGNLDKSTGEKKYYYPGCAQYEFTIVEKDIGEEWFCNKEDAEKAGFTKAETCR